MTAEFRKRKPRDVVFAEDLTREWRDGVVSHFPFITLRDVCPCAACVDELTGDKILKKNDIPPDILIKTAEYVGNYAIKIDWSDGHNTGIYSFRFLREFYDLAQEQGGFPGSPFSSEH